MKVLKSLIVSVAISASTVERETLNEEESLSKQKAGKDFSLYVESRDECPPFETSFCEERACEEWSCTNGDKEFSKCTAIVSNSDDSTERTCSCHVDLGAFSVFSGCKWKERTIISTSTTTTASKTTSTSTSTPSTIIYSTVKSEEAEQMLFDVELLGSDKNYEEELEEDDEKIQEYESRNFEHYRRAYPISGRQKYTKWDGGMGNAILAEGEYSN